MDFKNLLEKRRIKLNPLLDQFFLLDQKTVDQIINLADLKETDVVLEIGAGMGNLTTQIAKRAKKVIAFEVDRKFQPFLSKLPKNVKVHFENATNYFQLQGKFKKKKEFNKIVSNPPFSLIEPLLHNLTFLSYKKVILVCPIKIINKIKLSGVFSSFFIPEIKINIPKEKFYPIPKTNSVVIELIKLPDPIKNKKLSLFLRQYIYAHEKQLVKNSLMEGLIKYHKQVFSKKMTKNEAREIIKKTKIEESLLEKRPDNPEIYYLIEEEFKN